MNGTAYATRCPPCDAEIEPDEHEAIQGAKSAKIRTLNDRFGKLLTGGCVMMTAAVSALPDDVRARAASSNAPDHRRGRLVGGELGRNYEQQRSPAGASRP